MNKRTLLMGIALIVSVFMATSGTLAYLTDTDDAVNVMTIGNVDIEQHEMKRKPGVTYSGKLKMGDLTSFVDGVKMYPAYAVPDTAAYSATKKMEWGEYVHGGTAWNALWDDANLKGAVDKFVFVENTGTSGAYFRTIIAFECPGEPNDPDLMKVGEASAGAEIMVNGTSSDLYESRNVGKVQINGVWYEMFEYVYMHELLPGEWSHPSLLQVVMTHNATSEDMEKLGDAYEILVVTQAVQSANFKEAGVSAKTALNAAFGEIFAEYDKNNQPVDAAKVSHPWSNQAPGSAALKVPAVVSSFSEFEKAAGVADTEVILEQGITLGKNITLGEGTMIKTAFESDVDLNLSGKTITGKIHKNDGPVLRNEGTLDVTGGTVKSTANNGGSAIVNNGTMTVTGTTLNGAPNADGSWPSYTVNNTGVLNMKNVKLTSHHGAVSSYGAGAVVTLENCEIDMQGIPGMTSHGIYTYSGGKVIIKSGTYKNNATDQSSTGGSVINGDVEVHGGTFEGRIENYYGTPVIMGGTFNVNPTNFVATGYKAVENSNGTWTVSKVQ